MPYSNTIACTEPNISNYKSTNSFISDKDINIVGYIASAVVDGK